MRNLLLVALFGLLTPFPSFAAGTQVCEDTFSVATASPLENFTSKANERFKNFDQKWVRVQETDDLAECVTTLCRTNKLVMSYGREPIAQAWYNKKGTTLRFDIDVEPQFQQLGVYRYLLSLALLKNPGIEQIPSKMPYSDSENAKKFKRTAFSNIREYDQAVQASILMGLSDARVLQLRERIIQAALAMPALKVRQALGFGKLTKIVLFTHQLTADGEVIFKDAGAVGFVVKKGPQEGVSPQVIIQGTDRSVEGLTPTGFFLLGANGKVKLVEDSRANLADYDRIPYPVSL